MYTFLGRIVAFIAVILGILRIALGLHVAINLEGDPAAISRYLGGVANTGEAIDQGVYTLLAGISLGVFVEISLSLKKIWKNTEKDWEEDS